VVNNFTVCQNPIMIFCGGIKIFLLPYFCYYICFYPYSWDPHAIGIHIKSLPTLSYHFIHQHLFPTHMAFILALEDSGNWIEERAPEWRAGGTDRPYQQADRPPPLGPIKAATSCPVFHTHNSPKNLFEPLQCCLKRKEA
jgi:hypothetical protein